MKGFLLGERPPKLMSLLEFASAGDSFIPKLVFDFYGNFTLQDLLEAAGRMRAAVASLKLSKQLSAAQANSATGVVAGQDHLRESPPTDLQALVAFLGAGGRTRTNQSGPK